MLARIDPFLQPRAALLIMGGISLALLIGALLFQYVGKMQPCLLCLDQRKVHWTALTIAGLGLIASFIRPTKPVMTAVLAALSIVFAYSAWLAGYHAGVEWDFWDGPMACAAGAAPVLDPGAISLNTLGPGPAGPPCEVAAWRMFGLSMAGYNALASLALSFFAAAAAARLVGRIRVVDNDAGGLV